MLALIQCHIDHACSSWYSDLNKQLKKLQICQNKTVRFIKNLGPRSHIVFLELNSLIMLNVDFRSKQLRLSHVHKISLELARHICLNISSKFLMFIII